VTRHSALIAIYGIVVATAVLVGVVAIWAFIDQQSLVIAPEALPKVTVVTEDAH